MATPRSMFQRTALGVLGALVLAFGLVSIGRADGGHAHPHAPHEARHDAQAPTVFLDESFAVREGDRLELRLGSDDVTVETTTGPTARVVVRGEGRDARREFEHRNYSARYQDGLLSVRTDPDRGGWRRTRARFSVAVQVPERFAADLQVGSGDVRLERIDGRLALATGSGDVEVGAARGSEIRLQTGSGSIRAGRLDGDTVTLETGSGDVEVDEIAGATTIDTGSGEVEVGRQSGEIEVATGSGDVEVAFDRAYRTRVRTGSGEVTLRLPAGTNADVDLDGGEVDIDPDLAFEGRSDDDAARGTLGRGGPQISVGTGSGEIEIRTL